MKSIIASLLVMWFAVLSTGAQASKKNYVNKTNQQKFTIEIFEETKRYGSFVHLNRKYDRIYVQGTLEIGGGKANKYYEVRIDPPTWGCNAKKKALIEHTAGDEPGLREKTYLMLHPANFAGYGHPVSYILEDDGRGDVDGYRREIFEFLCNGSVSSGESKNRQLVEVAIADVKEAVRKTNELLAISDQEINDFLKSTAAGNYTNKMQALMWYAKKRVSILEKYCSVCPDRQPQINDANSIFSEAKDNCLKKQGTPEVCLPVAPEVLLMKKS